MLDILQINKILFPALHEHVLSIRFRFLLKFHHHVYKEPIFAISLCHQHWYSRWELKKLLLPWNAIFLHHTCRKRAKNRVSNPQKFYVTCHMALHSSQYSLIISSKWALLHPKFISTFRGLIPSPTAADLHADVTSTNTSWCKNRQQTKSLQKPWLRKSYYATAWFTTLPPLGHLHSTRNIWSPQVRRMQDYCALRLHLQQNCVTDNNSSVRRMRRNFLKPSNH